MFARLTFISIQTDKLENLRKIFNEEVVPVVKSQKGNLGIWLLEPTNENDEFVSLTEWVSKADADAYEASGTYRMLVDKIKDMYTSKPVLKTYNIADTKILVNA
jgi:quinol monooxygenase YgiN